MNDKIKPTHLERCVYVYVRQSTAAQVQYNKKFTDRQYKLTERALRLGWPQPQVKIVDEDFAHSGSGTSDRHGFAMMTAEVALGHVGLILSIEVSRVARNNADWYRLLDLCGVTDTLIGDERRALSSRTLQRPSAARIEGNHGRSRTPCNPCQTRRGHPQ